MIINTIIRQRAVRLTVNREGRVGVIVTHMNVKAVVLMVGIEHGLLAKLNTLIRCRI